MTLREGQFRLYHYWRSTSSWRVRFGLEAKGIKPEFVTINLLTDESDQPEHLARNPMGYVPVLETVSPGPNGLMTHYLGESSAILEWLEETHPTPALLPRDPFLRAHTRMLCEIVNSGTQPLQNLTVTDYLTSDKDVSKAWIQHWIRKGLHAFETLVQKSTGKFCVGDNLTFADIYLIPQCYAAMRNEVPLDEFPTIARIHAAAAELPSAKASHPDRFKPHA